MATDPVTVPGVPLGAQAAEALRVRGGVRAGTQERNVGAVANEIEHHHQRRLARQGAIEARRTKVGLLYERGWSQHEISRSLGIPLTTIHRDIGVIVGRWFAEQVRDVESVRGVALHRLAAVLQVQNKLAHDAGVPAALRLQATKAVVETVTAMVRLSGAWPAEKVGLEVTGDAGGPIQVQQLLAIASPTLIAALAGAQGSAEVAALVERAAVGEPALQGMAKRLRLLRGGETAR